MSRATHWCLPAFILLMAVVVAPAQETFRNPAMEPASEFQKHLTDGRMLARNGRLEEAIEEFKKAAKLQNNQCFECFHLIGRAYFQMSKYKEAASALKQALALKPNSEAEIYNLLGVVLYQQGDKKALGEAAAAFNRAIEIDSAKVPKAYYNLGYTLIKLDRVEEGKAALTKYLEANPSANNAEAVRAVIANPKLAFETLALSFKVNSTDGEELSLEKLKGKVVLLDFWATWCRPCLFEMPEVKKIWKKYSNDQFIIIGVSLDKSSRALEDYIRKEEITWPQYFDGLGWKNKLAVLYNIHSIPQTVLIDQEGIVRAVGLRGGNLSSKIGDLLKKLQKQQGGAQ